MRNLYYKAIGNPIDYDLTSYGPLLAEINKKDRVLRACSMEELRCRARRLKTLLREDDVPDNILVQFFSLGREAARRLLNMPHFDVQIIAGLVMYQGKIVEMQTGEGKTLAAVIPACMHAFSGRGVHIFTANDYLAHRDAEWMGPLYNFFGLQVSVVVQGMLKSERKRAYLSDITYLTAKEAGFDFLRDTLCTDTRDLVHRPFNFCIVDEADFILIDEARVPLVIAGNAAEFDADPYQADKLVKELIEHSEYMCDENQRNVHITEAGIDRIESLLGGIRLHQPENINLLTAINLSLHAHILLHKDRDYIVRSGKLELIDEFTGRVADNRRWPHGIQTTVSVKEGLDIDTEGNILGSMAMQNFIRLYPRIAGITATAQSAAEELHTFYNLTTVVIPPNRACLRVDGPDLVFSHSLAKQRALVKEIVDVHRTGRPILVGTSSVRESEELAELLDRQGVSCQILNAKNDDIEARIIAEAGKLSAVTISTNMAGRGTDIRLGGVSGSEYEKVSQLGGLYVIGTNKHESIRIDDQLRGRAGRQGDPGSSRFFISLEDDLMVRYKIKSLVPRSHLPDKQEHHIEDPVVSREINRAQRIIEGQNFEIRKTLWQYSEIVEEQRKIMISLRSEILDNPDGELPFMDTVDSETLLKNNKIQYAVLHEAFKQVALFHLDHAWSEHLELIADTREGIHLLRYGGNSPLNEFRKIVNKAFFEMWAELGDRIGKTVNSLEITSAGFDFEKANLKRPSSTWTYLINDNPFSNPLVSLISGGISGTNAVAGFMALVHLPILFILALIGKISRRREGR